MAPRLVKMTVSDVRTAVPAGAGIEAGLITLKENGPMERQLRIIVGQPEARAVHAAWHGQIPPRPSTWDLFVSALGALNAKLAQAVIASVSEQRHWYASITIVRDGERFSLACRPSDAIALALRSFGSEILANEQVLADAGVLADGSRPTATSPAGNDRDVDPSGREGTSFL